MLVMVELNDSRIEKMCLALMFIIQKIRHYMKDVISKDASIKHILSRPILREQLVKWL